ncbi:MAG: NUDIX domain-containing protein [Desulfobacterales bacterium]|nr:NUDIX domain-containing protein [Desulfobacterales bacterium]
MKDLENNFVVGFAFTEDKKQVLLVRKEKPPWQKGHLNGVGGKVKKGETPLEAMMREGHEETGLYLPWKYKARMEGINNDGAYFICHILYTYSDRVHNFIQKEEEILRLFKVSQLTLYKRIANIDFLIHFGICEDGCDFMTLSYV